MFTTFFDRVPRILSLLGLLGMIGLTGIIDPQLWRFSSLSFLSYLCYFRFLCWFVKPQPPLTGTGILIPLLGSIIWLVAQFIFPELLATAPMFGFIGFAGFLGLYGSASASQSNTTA